MKSVVGIFTSRSGGESVLEKLRAIGIDDNKVSLLTPAEHDVSRVPTTETEQPGMGAALGGIVGSIDRFAFWLSVVAGIAGWVYVETRRVPPLLTAGYRRQLQLFVLLCSAATGALIASVVSDGVLTSLRLAGTGWSRTFLVPLLSMAVEVACACVLGLQLRAMRRRTGCHG